MTLNGVSSWITFPDATRWQADVILSPGDNVFEIQGTDVADNDTEIVTVTVTLEAFEPQLFTVYNDVGRHALQQGLIRLPGEKNVHLLRRVADAPYYPSSTAYSGLVEAIARDLGLTVDRTAFSVTVRKDAYLNPLAQNVTLEITPSAVLVDADDLVEDHEACRVDPATNGFSLRWEPRFESDVEVFTRDRTAIDPDLYRVHVYDRRVVFTDDRFNNKWVRVRYAYRVSVPVMNTLDIVATALESIAVRGQQLLSVTVTDGGRMAEWLSHRSRLLITTEATVLRWAPVQIYNLHEERFRDSLLNPHGAGYNTRIEAWAKEIAKRSRFGWGAVVLDVDTWDTLYKTRNNAVLPHLFDSYRGYWRCADPRHATRYDWSAYVGYGGMCPDHTTEPLTYVGVADSEWHSGVGDGDDLKVTGIART
jgi:hypothetical protein